MQNEDRDGTISATIWDLFNSTFNTSIATPSEYKALLSKHGFSDITFTFTQEWNEYDIIYAKKAMN